MQVRRLKIESFRGIDNLTLEFSNKTPTVLIGINGVGKSSILECLAILLSQLIGNITQSEEEFKNNAVNIQGQTIQIQGNIYGNVHLYTTDNIPLQLSQYVNKIRNLNDQDISTGCDKTSNQITISLNSSLATWSLTKAREDGINGDKSIEELISITEQINHQWKANPDTSLPLAIYYGVNRAVIDISLDTEIQELTKQTDAYEQALNGVQINFNTFFQWFKKLEDLENEVRQDEPLYRNRQLQAVREAVNSLIPDFTNLRVRRVPLRMVVTKYETLLIIKSGNYDFLPIS